MRTTTITETCGCGATFAGSFDFASTASNSASKWREQHRCTNVAPGPCASDPGETWPDGSHPTCELRAGHKGAHEWDRGSRGGTAVWHDVHAAMSKPETEPTQGDAL